MCRIKIALRRSFFEKQCRVVFARQPRLTGDDRHRRDGRAAPMETANTALHCRRYDLLYAFGAIRFLKYSYRKPVSTESCRIFSSHIYSKIKNGSLSGLCRRLPSFVFIFAYFYMSEQMRVENSTGSSMLIPPIRRASL